MVGIKSDYVIQRGHWGLAMQNICFYKAFMLCCAIAYFANLTHIFVSQLGHFWVQAMGLLPDTKIAGCACAGNARNVNPPPTSKETAGERSRYASRSVRHARAVLHVGIANPRWRGNVPGIPGTCPNYLATVCANTDEQSAELPGRELEIWPTKCTWE